VGTDRIGERVIVKRGVVHTVVYRTLALDRYESGLEALQNGHLIGKAVLLMEP
jgi:hypothetical protein